MSGFFLQAAIAGATAPPTITPDLLGYDYQPHLSSPHIAYGAPVIKSGLRTASLPVLAHNKVKQGSLLQSYYSDYYNRIHIAPNKFALGNIVSIKQLAVTVWNAYQTPRALTSYLGLEEGLQVAGPSNLPLTLQANSEDDWVITVTPEGDPVLDAKVSWNFGSDKPFVLITANRVVAWPFKPDWENSVIERLSWLTDIHQSESLAEQRRAMRLAPRREWEATLYVGGSERQLLDMSLFGWAIKSWVLPIWTDVQLSATVIDAAAVFVPCTTKHLDFVDGGAVMLCGDDVFEYEVLEIKAVLTAGVQLTRYTSRHWPKGTRIYPCRNARIKKQPSIARITDQAAELSIVFQATEVCDWPAVMPTQIYRGYPVYDHRPDESQDLTSGFMRLTSELDTGMAMPAITDVAQIAIPVVGHRRLLHGRAERSEYKSLLYALSGKQKSVWVPTHSDDLTVKSIILPSLDFFDVANCGYSRFAFAKAGRRDIRIQLNDGAVIYRRIISAQEIGGGLERLRINAVIDQIINPSQIYRISYMALMRLDSDEVEIEHITDSEGIAESAVAFRGVRDDEF